MTYYICTEGNHYEYVHHMSRAPFIGCGDQVDTILTGAHQSLYCTYVICTYWFAECHLYETCGVQCLLSEGVLKTFCEEGASSDNRGLNIRYK